jgi:hypothetical protein
MSTDSECHHQKDCMHYVCFQTAKDLRILNWCACKNASTEIASESENLAGSHLSLEHHSLILSLSS